MRKSKCDKASAARALWSVNMLRQTFAGAVFDPGLANLRRDLPQEIRAGRHLSEPPQSWNFVESGYRVSARSLEELAGKIAVDPVQLRNTIARYNGFAETGVNIDFGKGETELNRFNGEAGHKPNPCIWPIVTPPFYALAVWPADIAISTGLATDANARVLGNNEKPIPDLYACGNDMASVMAGSDPGPETTTLGPAIVFAYRAAMHAKRQL